MVAEVAVFDAISAPRSRIGRADRGALSAERSEPAGQRPQDTREITGQQGPEPVCQRTSGGWSAPIRDAAIAACATVAREGAVGMVGYRADGILKGLSGVLG